MTDPNEWKYTAARQLLDLHEATLKAAEGGYVPHPDTDRYHGVPVAWAKPDDTAYGFCGLAGKQ
jgi:hypothetical protein